MSRARLVEVLLATAVVGAASLPVPAHAAAPTPAERAAAIVGRMTLDQKISQVHGTPDASGFRHVDGIPSLGIPTLYITNGPAGVAQGDRASIPSTALPAPIALAATFDDVAARQYGDVAGLELRDWGRNLIEGPMVNLGRVALDGRNFEDYGEDPYLSSRLAVSWIEAVQSHGVIAEVKHFIGNEQERNRSTVDASIDERTLHEIYLPPFAAAVQDAHVGSVMCAYPLLDGVYNCENAYGLAQVLRGELGFDGFVQSDFGATHSTVQSAKAGLDLEMSSPYFYDHLLKDAVQSGSVPVTTLDDMLIRRYTVMIRMGLFDHPLTPAAAVPLPVTADGAVARSIAERAMVLLKNDHAVLPLSASRIHSIAVVGPAAASAMVGGGGSSAVTPTYRVSTVAGITSRAGPAIRVVTDDGSDLAAATADARSADVAIVAVGDHEAEGVDRPNLSLPDGQDQLVAAVAAANPRTVVLLKTGGPVLMPWVDKVPAIVEAWYPGQEDGNAVAAVLFGDTAPGGKLPETFPARESDVPANTPQQYPGVCLVPACPNAVSRESYSEGLDVGYRWYDDKGVAPLFPFGFGLSYTTFAYAGLGAVPPSRGRPASVTFDIRNTGRVAADEVAQVYTGWPTAAAVSEPAKQLAGFVRVRVAAGETRRVTLQLRSRAFSYWDTTTHRWVVQPGCFPLYVGASSRDIRLTASMPVGGASCPAASGLAAAPAVSPAAGSTRNNALLGAVIAIGVIAVAALVVAGRRWRRRSG